MFDSARVRKFIKKCLTQSLKMKVLCAAALFIIVAVVISLANEDKNDEKEVPEQGIKRPSYNEQSTDFPISVLVEGEQNPINIDLQLEPRKYTYEQAQEIFETVYEKLLTEMLGSNAALDEVSSNLNFITQLSDYPITIQWYSDNCEIIDFEGNVYNQEFDKDQKEEVALTVSMEYMEYGCEYFINVSVVAPQMSEQELLKHNITAAINEQAQALEEEYVKLPTEVNGKKLTYTFNRQNGQALTYMFLAAVAVAAIIAGKKQEKKKALEYRKKQLQYDYSEVISKLMLLVGGGMAIRRAWEKIVLDYKATCKEKAGKRYVYEEMSESLNELNAGVPELAVYQNFGRRCDTKEYLKFSSLLVQNITKGTNDLAQMLELEAIDAFEGRKNLARKYGEEAGTKLLFPMIMMLGIVMAVIVIPAMMSF